MEVETAIKYKKDLETNIFNLIKNFQLQTGLIVKNIDYRNMGYSFGDGHTVPPGMVRVEVSVE